MVDFSQEKAVFRFKDGKLTNGKVIEQLLEDELIIFSFVGKRDGMILTSKRIVAYDAQGITGSKIDITSIPYNKIGCYSIETSGTLDTDSEINLAISGLGKINFRLDRSCDVLAISKFITSKIL